MKIGDRVRPSGYVTQQARDYWNNQGEHRRKERAKDELDRLVALRGTVLAMLEPGLSVQWDDGSIVNCLSHRVILAQ